jgi:hypothetical protein
VVGTGSLWVLRFARQRAWCNHVLSSTGGLAFAGFLSIVSLCHAQEVAVRVQTDEQASTPRIEVLHTPLQTSDVPPVGSLMRIEFTLTNTIDIETKIRLVGSKDGRFIDLAFPRGALNAADRPVFNVEIPSPVAVMTYQFVLHQKDGAMTATPRYTVKRRCIQNFTVDVPDDGSTTAFRREMASLVAKANSLDQDNKTLESALKLLEQMRGTLSR